MNRNFGKNEIKAIAVAFSMLALVACSKSPSTQNSDTVRQNAEITARSEAINFGLAKKLYEESQSKKALELRNCDKAMGILKEIKNPEQIQEYKKLFTNVQNRRDLLFYIEAKNAHENGTHCYTAGLSQEISNPKRFSDLASMKSESEAVCDKMHYEQAQTDSSCGKAVQLKQIVHRENFPKFGNMYDAALDACKAETGIIPPESLQEDLSKRPLSIKHRLDQLLGMKS